jgi:ABC-type phosphate transport system substrate-binding protein
MGSAGSGRAGTGGGWWARRCGLFLAGALLLGSSAPALSDDSFVVIINASVRGTSIHRSDLAAVFLKKAARWGGGQSANPVDQSGTSPVRRAFSDSVLQMPVAAVVQYWGQRLVSGEGSARPPAVKESDTAVAAYVAKTAGAVGYVAEGTLLPDGVKAVAIVD